MYNVEGNETSYHIEASHEKPEVLIAESIYKAGDILWVVLVPAMVDRVATLDDWRFNGQTPLSVSVFISVPWSFVTTPSEAAMVQRSEGVSDP
ncbi:46e6caf0-f216-4a2e-8b37-f488a68c8476 [Thermothielavioides terrestris]|uniref:46e6caf0-f216-4a2e-8b37-f488a68c8476 n=1 Tax=Thermothielavioides terrestris TaxID=2587410 RepID=A0A3S4AMN0_9PEZI|nr:46e6caf0-f216-4a2e-8b37-f488a68c8476 [Thermothielavioides terrestris]